MCKVGLSLWFQRNRLNKTTSRASSRGCIGPAKQSNSLEPMLPVVISLRCCCAIFEAPSTLGRMRTYAYTRRYTNTWWSRATGGSKGLMFYKHGGVDDKSQLQKWLEDYDKKHGCDPFQVYTKIFLHMNVVTHHAKAKLVTQRMHQSRSCHIN